MSEGVELTEPEMGGHAPKVSIVTTLYRSEATVTEFYRRAAAAGEALRGSFEIVFVDDGSPDGSAEIAGGIQRSDPRVVLVELSRNFGHHPAAVAGLRYARGERIFILDVDLEEQPEWLSDFAAEFDRRGADVVFGVSTNRKGSALKRYAGAAFWKLFNILSDTHVPENPCTIRLMSRRYVDALLTLPERNLFLAGNYAWLGFTQVPFPVEKGQRSTPSTYTPSRLIGLFVEAITSFTSYPLRLIFLVGVGIAATAFLAGLTLTAWKLVRPEAISMGWPSLMVSIWFLGGIIIAFLGVIGLYLSKVFNETKSRPLYVVRRVKGRTGAPSPGKG